MPPTTVAWCWSFVIATWEWFCVAGSLRSVCVPPCKVAMSCHTVRCRGSWTARLLAFAWGVVAGRGAGLGLLRRGQRCVIEVAPAPGFAGLDGPDDGVTAAVMVDARVPVPRVVAAADVTAGHAYPEVDPHHADAQAVLAAWGAGSNGLDGVEMGAQTSLVRFEPDQHRRADTRRHRCSSTRRRYGGLVILRIP